MSPENEPLWRVMEAAFIEGRKPGFSDRQGYAAEIRALMEWLVPEEPMGTFGDAKALVRTIMRDERQRLRALLEAEADRAETGDD